MHIYSHSYDNPECSRDIHSYDNPRCGQSVLMKAAMILPLVTVITLIDPNNPNNPEYLYSFL